MKKVIFLLVIILTLSSCASLTKTQIESVNQFGKTTSNYSEFTSKILTELAEIRLKRGLLYATTIENPKNRIEELDSVYSQKRFDYLISKKVDITIKIIDKYAQSLVFLSSDKYSKDLEEQAKRFGIGIDSLTTIYNTLDGVKKVPSGIGEAVSKLVILSGAQYIRTKQAKEIKKFLTEADTLISVMTSNLIEFLQSEDIYELINHEELMTKRDFETFISHNKNITTDQLKIYLEMKTSIDGIKNLREQVITATKNLRSTHSKLIGIISEKQKLDSTIKELQVLYEQMKELSNIVSDLQTN